MKKTDAAREKSMAKDYSAVRLFTVNRYSSDVPVHELDVYNILQPWTVASSGKQNM